MRFETPPLLAVVVLAAFLWGACSACSVVVVVLLEAVGAAEREPARLEVMGRSETARSAVWASS